MSRLEREPAVRRLLSPTCGHIPVIGCSVCFHDDHVTTWSTSHSMQKSLTSSRTIPTCWCYIHGCSSRCTGARSLSLLLNLTIIITVWYEGMSPQDFRRHIRCSTLDGGRGATWGRESKADQSMGHTIFSTGTRGARSQPTFLCARLGQRPTAHGSSQTYF